MASALNIPNHDLKMLRQSGYSLDSQSMHTAAEYIYDEFAKLPGGEEFLYELPVRIRSTAKLLEFLVGQFRIAPFDPRRVEMMFEAVGTSHARAGMPLALVGEGPAVFAQCLARVARERGREWTDDYSVAWERIMRSGVAIQALAYSEFAQARKSDVPRAL